MSSQRLKLCMKRLHTEHKRILRDPVPHAHATPDRTSMLEWHYAVHSLDGPYEGGVYWGKLLFPKDFPLAPPEIRMLTPSGRFATDTPLCLSISSFHPSTWSPSWSIGAILTGLVSFFVEDTPTTGAITTSTAQKRRHAREAWAWNCRQPAFRAHFPKLVEQFEAHGDTWAHELAAKQAAAVAAESPMHVAQLGDAGASMRTLLHTMRASRVTFAAVVLVLAMLVRWVQQMLAG